MALTQLPERLPRHGRLPTYKLLIMFYAALAQLVERDLAKVEVTSSSLVCRSKLFEMFRRNGRVAMHRIANPFTPVRLRVPPPNN